jgi:hypothetical protein
MKDFWAFRTMVTPLIIQVVFWIGTAVCVLTGLWIVSGGAALYGGTRSFGTGLGLIILGPLAVRIYCEILIIFFRINETLTEIKHVLERRATGAEG